MNKQLYEDGNILRRIADRRGSDLYAGDGRRIPAGRNVPERRNVPLVPFGRDPFVVCEIKKRSPSAGDIAPNLSPVGQAGTYIEKGAVSLSILTEEHEFGGSLNDLIEVKQAYPGTAVLRKDFLLDEEDIDISFRAGADAVLLIAALHDALALGRLHRAAEKRGMAVLMEVHSKEDVEKARSFMPKLVGINCRNLVTMRVDPLHPLTIRAMLDWPCRVVYESGISTGSDARLAGSAGFNGILVGEAVVRDPGIIPHLVRGLAEGQMKKDRFWTGIAKTGIAKRNRPLVKICGVTSPEDAAFIDECGADCIGFVFADSPRQADPVMVRKLPETRALKVGVVVLSGRELPGEIDCLLEDGKLDAVQFHGEETAAVCGRSGYPYYKAVTPGSVEEAERLFREHRSSPRILIDARVPGLRGGTGKPADPDVITAAGKLKPLWLAGGIGPETVRGIIDRYSPELIDASSLLESGPGIKNRTLLKRFFREVGYE